MAISRFTVENYVQETAEYYRARSKKEKADSIEQCNGIFRNTDGYLRTVLHNIKKQITLGRVPNFGISFPSINVTPKGMLGKKCCDCPSDPVPYKDKNRIRTIGEKFIKEWAYHAGRYLEEDNYKPDIGAKTRKPVVSKNPFE